MNIDLTEEEIVACLKLIYWEQSIVDLDPSEISLRDKLLKASDNKFTYCDQYPDECKDKYTKHYLMFHMAQKD